MAENDIQSQILQTTLDVAKETRREGEDPCVICLDFVKERATALPCGHGTFDFLCLVSWLQEQATCPLCKSRVKSVHFNYRSETDCEVYEISQTPLQSSATSTAPRVTPQQSQRRFQNVRWGPDPRRTTTELATGDAALLRRRRVYQHSLYSLHVGSNRLSRYTTLTPTLFSQDPNLVSKARSFIRRELQVFDFLSPDAAQQASTVTRRAKNVEFILEYIIAILKTVEIKGSTGQAVSMLGDFIGQEIARLFLHELSSWLRSPYTRLQDWDCHVQYNESHVSKRTTKRSFGHTAPPSRSKRSEDEPQRCVPSTHRSTYRFVDRYVPDYSSDEASGRYDRHRRDPG